MESVTSLSACHNGGGDGHDIGNSGSRQSVLTGEDGDFEILARWREEALLPMKDDLADWLGKTLGIEITADTFMSVLDNGVYLCKLAHLLQSKAEQAAHTPGLPKAPVTSIKYRERAKSGTWFARDNIASFLHWCQDWGVKSECMFETEGLVQHKEEKSVALCLLELARLGTKYGMEPPGLIKLEKEIETEESQLNNIPGKTVPDQVVKTPRRRLHSAKSDDLDIEVQRMGSQCRCPMAYQIRRMSEGKYNIGGKMMFIRLLKGRHVMVRVGGGWDTLSHYLSTHDPCRIVRFPKTGSLSSVSSEPEDSFLVIQAKYKSTPRS